eukprot:scaffold21632_cov23-Prasinocladus_malaysianus.AAC.1
MPDQLYDVIRRKLVHVECQCGQQLVCQTMHRDRGRDRGRDKDRDRDGRRRRSPSRSRRYLAIPPASINGSRHLRQPVSRASLVVQRREVI